MYYKYFIIRNQWKELVIDVFWSFQYRWHVEFLISTGAKKTDLRLKKVIYIILIFKLLLFTLFLLVFQWIRLWHLALFWQLHANKTKWSKILKNEDYSYFFFIQIAEENKQNSTKKGTLKTRYLNEGNSKKRNSAMCFIKKRKFWALNDSLKFSAIKNGKIINDSLF